MQAAKLLGDAHEKMVEIKAMNRSIVKEQAIDRAHVGISATGILSQVLEEIHRALVGDG